VKNWPIVLLDHFCSALYGRIVGERVKKVKMQIHEEEREMVRNTGLEDKPGLME